MRIERAWRPWLDGTLARSAGRAAVVSRTALVGLVVAVVLGAMALRADAQPRGSTPRVALLCAEWCDSMQTGRHEEGQAFVEALHQLGQSEGRTVTLDERGAGVKSGLANVTADLVRRNVDIILADGLPAAQAAKKATSTIPIVMVGVADPVPLGLVPSLARPGGNVTGVAVPFADLVKKQLELLQEAVPRTRRVGVLWNPDNPQHAPTLTAVEGAGRAAGVEMRLLQARSRAHTEIFLGRGVKFLTVVSNLETGEPLWLGQARKRETLDRYFAEALPRRRRRFVRAVCVDMWKPFVQSLRVHLPHARIVCVLRSRRASAPSHR